MVVKIPTPDALPTHALMEHTSSFLLMEQLGGLGPVDPVNAFEWYNTITHPYLTTSVLGAFCLDVSELSHFVMAILLGRRDSRKKKV